MFCLVLCVDLVCYAVTQVGYHYGLRPPTGAPGSADRLLGLRRMRVNQ